MVMQNMKLTFIRPLQPLPVYPYLLLGQIHPMCQVWSTKSLVTLTGFGAKNTVRILASCTLVSSASTTTSRSKNSIRIISEPRKHSPFKPTMKSLAKKHGKLGLYCWDLTGLSDPCFFLFLKLLPPLATMQSICTRARWPAAFHIGHHRWGW